MANPGDMPANPDEALARNKELLDRLQDGIVNFASDPSVVEAFDEINTTLPPTHRFVNGTDAHKPTDVYGWNDDKQEWEHRSRVTTLNRQFSFVGDQIDVLGDQVVVLNTDLGLGIAIQGIPLTMEAVDDIEGKGIDKSFGALLGMIADTQPGEGTVFDFTYS